MRTISWILLAIVAVLTLLGSLASAGLAYAGSSDAIASTTIKDLAAGRLDILTALRARRATAAAYAAAFAVLLLIVVLLPYRRGDVWSWWAILISTGVLFLISAVRIPVLSTRAGTGGAAIQFGVVLVALLLDAKRLRSA
ncbi:MAG TPA: hypothetical protein VGK99_00110 [Acidobacteriota bacterium]|jgi:peptidoglycan/LPS O-acetylase OafA/YrhL